MLLKISVLVMKHFIRKCISILSFLHWLLKISKRVPFELSNLGIHAVFNDFNLQSMSTIDNLHDTPKILIDESLENLLEI